MFERMAPNFLCNLWEINMNLIFRLLAYLFVLLAPNLASAQGDGPRTYMVVPEGTQLLSQFYFNIQGNQTADSAEVIPNGEIDVNLMVSMYTATFEVMGKQGAVFGLLPYGQIDGSLSAFGRSIGGSAHGVGDLTVGGIMGLINSASLAPQDYAAQRPTPNFGILAKVTVPTGSYDSNKTLNLGANRWAFQIGTPMAANFGKSMIDPRLTSFELFPSVTFFTDNHSPSGRASVTSQEPIYQLEAHITHNLNRALWVSLDALQVFGGETGTDGIGNNDSQNSLSIGGTMGISFTPSTFLKASYGHTVYNNEHGADGGLLRLQLGYIF